MSDILECQRATTDKKDPNLDMGLKHGKKWVGKKNWGKMHCGVRACNYKCFSADEVGIGRVCVKASRAFGDVADDQEAVGCLAQRVATAKRCARVPDQSQGGPKMDPHGDTHISAPGA